MNRIIAIGFTSNKTCYLNISREEALKKWLAQNSIQDITYTEQELDDLITELHFTDSFMAYDIWNT